MVLTRLRSGAGKRRNYRSLAGLPPRRTRRRPARLSNPVKAAVSRLISRKAETKHASATLENLTGHNSAIGSADAVCIVPTISQGTDDFNRIGDRISTVAMYVKGRIGLTYNDQANNRPISVRVMVVSQRTVRDASFLSAWTPNLLLSANDAASGLLDVAYDGTARNAMYPVNKNMFQVHYKRDFTMYPSQGNAAGVGVESENKTLIKWGAKIKVPKTLMYYNSSATSPQNYAPFLLIGYCYADGSSPDVTTLRVTSTTVSTLYFKDA